MALKGEDVKSGNQRLWGAPESRKGSGEVLQASVLVGGEAASAVRERQWLRSAGCALRPASRITSAAFKARGDRPPRGCGTIVGDQAASNRGRVQHAVGFLADEFAGAHGSAEVVGGKVQGAIAGAGCGTRDAFGFPAQRRLAVASPALGDGHGGRS